MGVRQGYPKVGNGEKSLAHTMKWQLLHTHTRPLFHTLSRARTICVSYMCLETRHVLLAQHIHRPMHVTIDSQQVATSSVLLVCFLGENTQTRKHANYLNIIVQ